MIDAGLPTDSALTELLRARLDPGLRCTGLRRAEAGNAQEIWFVDAAGPDGVEVPLVLRLSAGAGSLAHTDREREARVLRALAGTGLPVPRVHWDEGADGALGRPYLMMERLPGRPAAAGDEAAARELGELLARLHAAGAGLGREAEGEDDLVSGNDGGAGPASEGEGGAGLVPGDEGRAGLVSGDDGRDAAACTEAELATWRRRHEEVSDVSVPRLAELLDWLAANPPAREGVAATLLWGDPGPHNLLVEEGRVTAMLDWELWHRGDPLEDVGTALWALRGPARGALLAGYESVAGPVDRGVVDWFEALACATRSVMLLAGVEAFLAGQPRPSAAGLGHLLLLASLARAAALTGGQPEPAGADLVPRERPPHRLRPDAPETIDGVADFLAAEVLPAIADRRLRRELKVAAALLRDAALQAGHEDPDPADLGAQLRSIPHVGALYEGRSEAR